MTFYRPPSKAEKRGYAILDLRKSLEQELRAAKPSLSSDEISRLVVHRIQHGAQPSKPGIPKEVLEARRKERRATVARGKAARLGDKRPGQGRRG